MSQTPVDKRLCFAITIALIGFLGSVVAAANNQAVAPADSARTILQETGVHGGLIVHLGCGDGKLTAALHATDSFLVHGLDTDPANVALAREFLRSHGLYGPVSVDRLTGTRLPYIDNLVNLVVAQELGAVSKSEILRVLAPHGIAYLEQDGQWTKIVKPRSQAIDEWTHYLHDPSNNAVAHDSVVGPPRRMQWVGGPRYSRHHDRMSSLSASVTAGGRVFYIYDEASPISVLIPPKWSLIARDAFNGTVLWRRPIHDWFTHLWPLKSGPAQLPRRLVASADRVYVTLGFDAPLVALDAATGETIRTYDETKATEELVLSDGVLFALVNDATEKPDYEGRQSFRQGYRTGTWDGNPRKIMALRAETGAVLWVIERHVLPGTLAIDQDRVVFHDGASVVCLDRRSGNERWRSEPVARAKDIRSFFVPNLVLYEDVVLFAGGETAGLQTGSWYESGKDTLTALSADTGKVLWSAYHPPSGYRSPEDLFVVNGLVWTDETTSGRAVGTVTGRDLHTGEVKVEFSPDVETYWFHHRCYRSKATDKYLLTSRTGIEFVDIRNQHWATNHWVRGACLYGVMPANGLLYAPQHPCACYLEAKLYGFNALAPENSRVRSPESGAEDRLQRGPAYESTPLQTSASSPRSTSDWPTYRHDASRSGCASTSVSPSLKPAWQADVGSRLTSPVIAAGKLFVAAVDTHTVYAFDAGSGKELWHYTTGGRVDSPPTVYHALVLFGSADGSVYALRAADGVLAWRFRAAPTDQRLMAFEQVESVWPVHGSVLVQDGVLYCVSGRSMFLDGGLSLWRLDPHTGRVLSETRLNDHASGADKALQSYVSWLNMPPALPDILSSDGRFVYMRSQPFHLDGTRLPLEPMPHAPDVDRGAPPPTQHPEVAHLFSPTGFLDDTGWHRSYWMYGSTFISGWSGYYLAGKVAPAGRILVFDDSKVYGFGRKPQYYRWSTPIEQQLFATDKKLPTVSNTANANQRESRIEIANSESLKPADKPLTVEAWVNALKPDGVVLAHGGSIYGYTLYLQGGRPHFGLRIKKDLTLVAAEQKVTGRWTHIAGVLTESGELQIFIDGTRVASKKAPGLLTQNPQDTMQIGGDAGSTVGNYTSPFAFTGLIDEVHLYHRALSDSEIAASVTHTSQADADDDSLVLAYSFDKGNAVDESSYKNNGQVDGVIATDGKIGRAMKFAGGIQPVGGYRVHHDWTRDVPLFVRAIVLADDTLFAAGPPDLIDEEQAYKQFDDPKIQSALAEQATAYAGKKGALLYAVSARNGEKLAEYKLDAPPVFDGLAAADGRLYLAAQNGTIICFQGQ